MKILHITPHLGGGVGKAHAAIGGALPKNVARTFLLLEQARDRRYADLIQAGGATVLTANGPDHASELAADADIVQFEFWNHPRLFECLARSVFPALRSVFWSHISGLAKPVIQPGLIEHAGRFVFSTEASRALPSVVALSEAAQGKVAVINSGFGFAEAPPRAPVQGRTPVIAYLGTVDFVKMHPGFFDAVDRLDGRDIRVRVWGNFDPQGAVAVRARAMRHPERIVFNGQTAEPAEALAAADIFFYPLQRDHYGTAENALVEAMSLGIVPVVLNNPAELTIVSHGETGFVARSVDECAVLLQKLLSSPDILQRVSRNAMSRVAQTRTPVHSAREFMSVWRGLLGEPKTHPNFRAIVGENPANWFLATQCLPGETWRPSDRTIPEAPSKGMLAHFESAFPRDASLSRLSNESGGVPR
jgi:glycosyltransferase involved in cell wall biosynthesis